MLLDWLKFYHFEDSRSTKDIEAAIEKGKKYNPDIIGSSYFTSKSMGIDSAWGSSAFGIVVTQWEDNHIQILHAEEYHRPDYNEISIYSIWIDE
jgi:hypothetical protein